MSGTMKSRNSFWFPQTEYNFLLIAFFFYFLCYYSACIIFSCEFVICFLIRKSFTTHVETTVMPVNSNRRYLVFQHNLCPSINYLYSSMIWKLSIHLGGEYPFQKQNHEAAKETTECLLCWNTKGYIKRMEKFNSPKRCLKR